MISFIWSDKNPMYSGRGGMENFTAGHIRELNEMGIESQVVTVGLGKNTSNGFFPDIKFKDVDRVEDLEVLDDIIIFINVPHEITTKNPSYVLYHCPPRTQPHFQEIYKRAMKDKTAISTSHFMVSLWSEYLNLSESEIPIVYPFADPEFGKVVRPIPTTDTISVLFAGRLMPEKGVYLFLEMTHHTILKLGYSFSMTTAGNQTDDGMIIEKFLKHHSRISLVDAKHNPTEMAALLAQYQILVMPSTNHYWHEGFGMLSVEAQHAGCQVIGSNNGGLPETNCGGLTLFDPGDSLALAEAIRDVGQAKPVTLSEKNERSAFFTRHQSVEALLEAIRYSEI